MWSINSRNASIQRYQKADIIALATASPEAAGKIGARPFYTELSRWLPAPGKGRLLELGCGPGRYAALLASMGYDVVAVDPYEFPDWSEIRARRKIEFLSDIRAEELPFADGSYDFLTCLNALLYFSDPRKAASEMHRVTKPGGRLVVRTVNRTNLVREFGGRNMDPAAPNYYTEGELADFLTEAGFKVQRTFAFGFFLPVAPDYWWYLCNGPIPIRAQEWFSALTPRRYRTVVAAFAEKPTE